MLCYDTLCCAMLCFAVLCDAAKGDRRWTVTDGGDKIEREREREREKRVNDSGALLRFALLL